MIDEFIGVGEREGEREEESFLKIFLRNLLMQLWGLAGLKSSGKAIIMDTQGRVDTAVLSKKAVLMQNSFFSLGGESSKCHVFLHI